MCRCARLAHHPCDRRTRLRRGCASGMGDTRARLPMREMSGCSPVTHSGFEKVAVRHCSPQPHPRLERPVARCGRVGRPLLTVSIMYEHLIKFFLRIGHATWTLHTRPSFTHSRHDTNCPQVCLNSPPRHLSAGSDSHSASPPASSPSSAASEWPRRAAPASQTG